MSERRVDFTVYGKAEPGGSKLAGQRKDGTRFVRDDNPKVKEWMGRVAAVAADAMDGEALLTGALTLRITFYVVRPAGHLGTGRNAGTVKRSAPEHPTTRPDLTKLVRAVEDALKGVVWRDDSQVVWQQVGKTYAAPPHERARCEVEVTAVPLAADFDAPSESPPQSDSSPPTSTPTST
jgi:Holliday junction resolvase RusA-like endonuclease